MSESLAKLNNNSAFCALPWLHFYAGPSGDVRVCCVASETLFDEKGQELNIRTHTLDEIWNSPAYQRIRKDMASGKKVKDCSYCYKHEALNGNSTRLGHNKRALTVSPRAETNIKIIEAEMQGVEPPLPGSIDVRLSNLCNLGCRMCKADASSQIENDPVHSKWAPYQNGILQRQGALPARSGEAILADLLKFDNIHYIQLAGGEPTLIKEQIGWLTALAQSGKSKEIDLDIWTNFTTSNRKIFDVISSFKSVSMFLSIDAIGDVYDYVRWPGRWSAIEKNLDYVSSLRDRITLRMNAVLQAYNVFNIPLLLDWARANSIYVILTTVAQDYLDYRILSDGAQDRARGALKDYMAKLDRSSKIDAAICHAIENWLSQTEIRFSEANKAECLNTFIELTNDLDRSRKQSLAATIPDVYNDIVGTLGEWPQAGRFTEKEAENRQSA